MPNDAMPSVVSYPRAPIGAWLWLFCFQYFVGEQLARLGWTGHYSMTHDYISDLGSLHCQPLVCSSLHWVMNGSFVLQGLLIVCGAVMTRAIFSKGSVYQLSFALLVLAGLGVLLVGLVPEDSNFRWHIAGALANFLGGNVAMILLGRRMIRLSVCDPVTSRVKSWLTFAAGSVGLLATLALGFRGTASWAALGWQAGLVERMAAYPLPLWLTWMGFLLLRGEMRTSNTPA